MSAEQEDSERAVFALFAEAAGLPLVPSTIESRKPPQPDIHCVFASGGRGRFELVEVIDTDLAQAVGIQIKFQTSLAAGAASRQIKSLSDALVFVEFVTPSTNHQRQQACESLLNILEQLPADFRGNVNPAGPTGLADGVRKVRITRGDFVGPVFQVGGAAFLSDPISDRLQEKFGKTYESDTPIQLLAYYHMHPTYRAEYELPGVNDYVQANLAASPFERVWVFDVENRQVLYRS